MAGPSREINIGAGSFDEHRNVEIERKFAISMDTEIRIVQAGGTCVKHTSFSDAYFDTDAFQLTLADHWLRRRDGKWELKAPLSKPGERNNPQTCTKYLEFTNEHNIIASMSAILLTDCGSGCGCASDALDETLDHQCMGLEKWLNLQNLNLKPFAEYTTKRKTFSINEGLILIVMDETDFGFSVGEIEVMSRQSGDDLAVAVAQIDEMVEKIGLGAETVVEGKMGAYLKQFVPHHYETLLACGILK